MLVPVCRRTNLIALDERLDILGAHSRLVAVRADQQTYHRPQEGRAEEVVKAPPARHPAV